MTNDEKDAIEASKAHYDERLAELSKFGGFVNGATKNINSDFVAGFLAGRKGRVEPLQQLIMYPDDLIDLTVLRSKIELGLLVDVESFDEHDFIGRNPFEENRIKQAVEAERERIFRCTKILMSDEGDFKRMEEAIFHPSASLDFFTDEESE